VKILKKQLILLFAALTVTAGMLTAQEETVINFDNATIGSLPAGWTNASGKWIVKQDGENKVLAQTFENRGMDFNVAVYDGVTLKDVEMSVDIMARRATKTRVVDWCGVTLTTTITMLSGSTRLKTITGYIK